ncbi:hypothetical protein ABID23_000370 [Bartonella silvatica]|uniref:Uncharacterized protein n=1 Tax=Bartonella silvatica TaxID=357760 RepID=A0ABV2HFH1_9HYPH
MFSGGQAGYRSAFKPMRLFSSLARFISDNTGPQPNVDFLIASIRLLLSWVVGFFRLSYADTSRALSSAV